MIDTSRMCCRCGATGHLAHACTMPLLPIVKPTDKPVKLLMPGEPMELSPAAVAWMEFQAHMQREIVRTFGSRVA